MNYIKELNAFREFLLENELAAGAISLWHALMSINNKTMWKRRFNGPGAVVGQLAGLSKQGVVDARAKLVEYGLIRYDKGCPGKAPVYEMISLVQEEFAHSTASTKVEVQEDMTIPSLNKAASSDVGMTDGNMNDHVTWMSLFAEMLAGAFVPFVENRSGEKQETAKDDLSDTGDNEKFTYTVENTAKVQTSHRLRSYPRPGEHTHKNPISFFKEKQMNVPSGYSQSNRLHPLLDSPLDQSTDRNLTVRKQKQNKTEKRQDRITPAQVYSMFVENIGTASGMIQAELQDWIQKMGEGVVTEAIRRAAKHGGKTFSYVEKILLEWEQKQIQSVEACRRYQLEYDTTPRPGKPLKKQSMPTSSEPQSLFDELRKEAEA